MSEMQVGRLEGVRILTGSAIRPCEVPMLPIPRIIAASVYHVCLQIGAEWRARNAA